ncbi:MAG: RIP metalloprotease RseP [Patescibacteria group bacterium]
MFITLAVIISLSLIVFFHEFGHFVLGRFLGTKVEEFGFGYPPRFCGIVKVNGRYKFFWGKKVPEGEKETIYSINWIPLGGFNKFAGEEAGMTKDPNYFYAKPWWQRIVVALGGPIMNIVLAMMLLIFASGFGSYQEITPDLSQKGLLIKEVGIRIIAIAQDSPAEKAGLKIDDQIISLDNQNFSEISQIQNYVKDKLNRPIKFQIKRKKEILNLTVQPKLARDVYKNEKSEGAAIGIAMAKIGCVYYPIHLAIWNGLTKTFTLLGAIFQSFFIFLKELIIHKKMIAEVVGVVGLASMTAQAAQTGIVYLMQFVATISLLLVITQVIPFPALDGGRILFFLIEGIRGKPVNPKIENAINSLGFTLLLILMVYITYKDLIKLGENLFK